jgi:GTP pyrophosphokinase
METATQASPQITAMLEAARAALLEDGGEPAALQSALEAATEVAALTQDADLALATALHWARRLGALAREPAAKQPWLRPAALSLAAGLERLGELHLPANWSAGQSLKAAQAQVLRKMLLAVAGDPRLVVARLAEHLVQLRHARELAASEQMRLALEAREILAPLANRLGIWNLKWELEDLAFRHLQADDYERIARSLAEPRVERERYIEAVCTALERELRASGITATIYGRPKHIYSIYRKMQLKQVQFEQVFDVRAVRILVESLAECYAALGVVHGLWRFIPGEFDDYIATPKDNDYRSIHTAVIGPQEKSLEIQIRSREMHAKAELGVAAH